MIICSCNYCDNLHMVPFHEPGVYERIQCENCSGVFFLLHSRIDPLSWKEEDIEINEQTKTIRIRNNANM